MFEPTYEEIYEIQRVKKQISSHSPETVQVHRVASDVFNTRKPSGLYRK